MSDGGMASALLQGFSLLFVVGLPAILAAGYAYRPWRELMGRLAPWAALPALLLAMLAPSGITAELSWLLLGSQLGMDETARVFLFFTALLWFLAGFYARAYVQDDHRDRFFALYLITMSGNLGLILAQDMLSFFLGFATMSFASYGLIVHHPDAEARFAARIYMILVVVGEVLLFAAMVWAAFAAMVWGEGSGNYLLLQDTTRALAQAPGREFILALFLVGFGIKVGALPLHVSLPLIYKAAPAPASAVLSGAMIKAGLLGWMRFLPLGVADFPAWGAGCIAIGLAAAFYGVLVGLTQRHPKTVLAYSSISQMGLMTVAIGCGLAAPSSWPMVSLVVGMYALHHALAKGVLFLGVGVAATRIDTAWQRGLVGLGLLLPALALAGAPYTSGAAAKVSLKAAAAMAPSAWFELLETLLPLSAVGTTLLMGRFIMLVWPRPASHSSRLTPGLWVPWVLLLLGTSISVFVWPWPGELTPIVDAFSSKLAWKAFWPVGVGAFIVLAVWGGSRWIGWRSDWQIPAGDILVPVNRLIEVMSRAGGVTVGRSLTEGLAQVTSKWAAVTAQPPWHAMLSRSEQSLASWSVAGMLFLFLAAALLACLITLSA
ncbi:MAG: hypothetical protein ETSY1_20555 [Candidatus Entotheonella factor]|uniref:NADH:quinone oxidoreductase/Mrp antiporter transmembrane domain-containing protein n=1 Tax=Entotheonella factor TaxID=1429438 RepID=W4LJV7_ENTF1|nr:MAG: hypothetical protein ETSY1_20555 [Candidatus Entotheonella factor]